MECKYLTVKEYILFLLTYHLLPTLKASIASGYLGCYGGSTVTGFIKRDPNPNPNGGEICKDLCMDMGYRYAGTKNGRQCYCGTAFGEYQTKTGCIIECRSNPTEMCGGKNRISIHDTWKCATYPCNDNEFCEDIDGNNYTCTCTDGWTGVSCDHQVNEESSLIAVYVAVPVTVILAFSVVVVCIIWRKRNVKCGSKAGYHGSVPINDSLSVSPITNATYTAHNMNHNAETTQNGDMSGSNDDYYTEIPLENIQATSDANYNEYNTIEPRTSEYDVPENRHGHMIKGTAPFVDIAYSHMDKYPMEGKSGTMDNTYSHIGNGQKEATLKQTAVDVNDTYNVLQTISHSQENKETKQREFDKEGDSVYDHAIIGSQNKTNEDADEYAHLNRNMETAKSHILHEDQHIVVHNDNNSTCKDDLVDRHNHAGYEQAVGLTPHYFVLESEDHSFADNNISGKQQCASHVDETEYEVPSEHEYFVLEKTDTKV